MSSCILLARVSLFSSVLWSLTAPASAQAAALPSQDVPFHLESGNHANPTAVEGVVWRGVVDLPATTPWLRLQFHNAVLDKGSRLRIVSFRDGDVMTMQPEHLVQWGYTSAYFNGNAVMIELIAGPQTSKNSVEIAQVTVGTTDNQPVPETICGTQDNRVATIDARIGRIWPPGCTGWIANVQGSLANDRVVISAGHCLSTGQTQVLQFLVPDSARDCTVIHPPAARQFAIDQAGSQSSNGGDGRDWWVFRCFPNPTSGLTVYQSQGAAWNLATTMPNANGTCRVDGYGADGTAAPNSSGGNSSCSCTPSAGTGERHMTLQTASGAITVIDPQATFAHYTADTCGGNSGSPVIAGTSAFAIHTTGRCELVQARNTGTLVSNSAFNAALATVSGQNWLLGNDQCFQARPVVTGPNGPFSSIGATTSTQPFGCGTGTGNDVWFVYQATCTGTTTVDTCSSARTFDTVLEAWDFCNGSRLACNDDMGSACTNGPSPNLASRVAVTTTAGRLYLIRVAGYQGATGNFGLNVNTCNLADECVDAVPLSERVNGPFTTTGATASATTWSCGPGARPDVWFYYDVPGRDTDVTFTTCDAASFDTLLEVFDGGCGNLRSLACNDDIGGACGLTSAVTVRVAQPSRLYVRVGAYAATGTFLLTVTPRPVNDHCLNATTLPTGTSGPFSNLGADDSTQPWSCGPGGSDVWFEYTTSTAGPHIFSTCTANLVGDTVLQIYSGPCPLGVLLACNDDSCSPGALGSTVTIVANAAQTYLIRVGGHNGSLCRFEVSIGAPVANDECLGASTLVLGRNGPFTNAFATTSLPAWTCGTSVGNDVWFRFTAAHTAPHTFSTCSGMRTFAPAISVFSGSCRGLVAAGCDAGSRCAGVGSRVTVPLTQGNAYLIRVGGIGGATGTFDLDAATGTGTGVIVQTTPGCGSPAPALSVTGNPNLGGQIVSVLNGPLGMPFISLGFLPAQVHCGCTWGHSWLSTDYATQRITNIPVNASFIGLTVGVQGAVIGTGLGGCAPLDAIFTPTFTFTIG